MNFLVPNLAPGNPCFLFRDVSCLELFHQPQNQIKECVLAKAHLVGQHFPRPCRLIVLCAEIEIVLGQAHHLSAVKPGHPDKRAACHRAAEAGGILDAVALDKLPLTLNRPLAGPVAHGMISEKPSRLLDMGDELLGPGNLKAVASFHHNGLQVLGAHDRTHPGFRGCISAVGHDGCEMDPVLTCRPDAKGPCSLPVSVGKGLLGFKGITAPQILRINQSHLVDQRSPGRTGRSAFPCTMRPS